MSHQMNSDLLFLACFFQPIGLDTFVAYAVPNIIQMIILIQLRIGFINISKI
jgi:hypothetical protein